MDIIIWYGTVKNHKTKENKNGGIFISCILNALHQNVKQNYELSLDALGIKHVN